MEKKTGILGYNSNEERMGILSFDLWVKGKEGLHCGSTFEVLINDEWIADRLELSQGQWYLVYSKLKGDELEGLKIRY